jgi:hypothetical protein
MRQNCSTRSDDFRWATVKNSEETASSQQVARHKALVRVLLGFTVFISLWLFGHFYMTMRHDTTAWKLAGMAMYVKAGPRYALHWSQRFAGDDHTMRIGSGDLAELYERNTNDDFILSFGNLLGFASPARYLMSTRQAPYPIVATVERRRYSVRRSRYIDRSCRYELIYLDGEMLQNRICRSLEEAVVELD